MAFKKSVSGGHCFYVSAGTEGLAVSGEQNGVNIVPIPDILQGFGPQMNHFFAEAVELLRAV